MSFLPIERVEDYLTNTIKIPDWKLLMEKSKLEFLTVFQRQTFLHIYFQNIRMVSTEISKRRAPTLEEVIETGFRGDGGICNEINTFNRLILVSLGFDAYDIGGSVEGLSQGTIVDCHVMTIVRFPPDKLYLIDTASGNPLNEPVPIHQLPHSGEVAGVRYEFRNLGNGKYGRYQCGGTFMYGQFGEGRTEQPRFFFTLEEKNFEDFVARMNIIYTEMKDTLFLDGPFLFRCTEFTEDKSEFVIVRRKKIMIATPDTMHVLLFSTFEEMKPEVEKFFPKLNKQQVELAWKVFNNLEP